ncbi:MAG: hypothetical protein COB40_13245 [Marinosulfonomonas sp.]|nr:MAG: hypothetical protein COB40_13245 [Marinosulfonomonas sp.]
MKNPLFLAALAGLTALSACGGTGGASATLSPITMNAGGATNLTGTVPSGLANGAQATILNSGVPIPGVIKDNANLLGGTFGGAQNPGTSNTFNVVAFSDDGKSTPGQTARVEATVIGASVNSSVVSFDQIGYYGRVTAALLPVGGTATYNGDYRATYGSATGVLNGVTGGLIAVTGTSKLIANFNNSTISGSIIGRNSLLSNGGTIGGFANVTLGSTSITNNGTYSGTATGGTRNGQGFTLASGQYQGLFGGANSDSVAGALVLIDSGGFTEVGVFTGKR